MTMSCSVVNPVLVLERLPQLRVHLLDPGHLLRTQQLGRGRRRRHDAVDDVRVMGRRSIRPSSRERLQSELDLLALVPRVELVRPGAGLVAGLEPLRRGPGAGGLRVEDVCGVVGRGDQVERRRRTSGGRPPSAGRARRSTSPRPRCRPRPGSASSSARSTPSRRPTSSARPVWNVTPLRIVNVQVLPSLLEVHVVASSGSTFCVAESYRVSVSYMLLIAMTSFEYEVDGSHPDHDIGVRVVGEVVVGGARRRPLGVRCSFRGTRREHAARSPRQRRYPHGSAAYASFVSPPGPSPSTSSGAGGLRADPDRRVREVCERDLFQFYDLHVLRRMRRPRRRDRAPRRRPLRSRLPARPEPRLHDPVHLAGNRGDRRADRVRHVEVLGAVDLAHARHRRRGRACCPPPTAISGRGSRGGLHAGRRRRRASARPCESRAPGSRSRPLSRADVPDRDPSCGHRRVRERRSRFRRTRAPPR